MGINPTYLLVGPVPGHAGGQPCMCPTGTLDVPGTTHHSVQAGRFAVRNCDLDRRAESVTNTPESDDTE